MISNQSTSPVARMEPTRNAGPMPNKSRITPALHTGYKSGGFTLIELIAVIAILSIIAVIGTGFIVSSTESYNQTQTRAKLVNKSRQAIERITRQVRGALPNSIQITGSCVKFLPLASGGYYLNTSGAANASSITTGGYRVDFGTARHISIGALNSGAVYGSATRSLSAPINPGTVAPVGSVLSFSGTLALDSVSQRFYLLDDAQAFCINGGNLEFLQGNSISWTPSGAGDLMAEQVAGSFSLQTGTESRNTILTMNLNFSEGGETVLLTQEVHIRNVP